MKRCPKKVLALKVWVIVDNSVSEKTASDIIIKKKNITDSSLNLNFKFSHACCQTFTGDYRVKNDTLFFEYKNIGGGVCKCKCWYEYELKIIGIKNKFKTYKIISK